MGVLEQHQAAAAERDVAERRPAGEHVGGAAAHEDDVAVRLDPMRAGLMPEPDEVVAADRPAEQAGEETRSSRSPCNTDRKALARRRVLLPQPEPRRRPAAARRPRAGAPRRARRVPPHVPQELQAAGADGLAVEQAGHEQVAVLTRAAPVGPPGRRPRHWRAAAIRTHPPRDRAGGRARRDAGSWRSPPGCIASRFPAAPAVRDIRTRFVRRAEDCDKQGLRTAGSDSSSALATSLPRVPAAPDVTSM